MAGSNVPNLGTGMDVTQVIQNMSLDDVHSFRTVDATVQELEELHDQATDEMIADTTVQIQDIQTRFQKAYSMLYNISILSLKMRTVKYMFDLHPTP